MSIIGATDFGPDVLLLKVDHDPTSVNTDAPKGSLISFNELLYKKNDDGSSTDVSIIPSEGGGAVVEKIVCCSFGGSSSSKGKFLISNGDPGSGEDDSKPSTRQPIGVTGTLITLAYQTENANSGTVMKIHINGVVAATVPLSNINGNKGGVETVSVAVTAGDYAELEYDAGKKPKSCSMYFVMEPDS